MRTARFQAKGVWRLGGQRPTVHAYVPTSTATHRWPAFADHNGSGLMCGRAVTAAMP
jgi:hypothetical protein